MHSTLNRVFRVIWCKVRLAWVAVSEVTSGCGKVQSNTRRADRDAAAAAPTHGENMRAVWDDDHLRLVPLRHWQPASARRWHPLDAAAELATPRTLLVTALASTSALAAPPLPAPAPTQLPAGGQVVAGRASIVQNANTLMVNQASDRAIVNWSSFNVGNQATVNFVQPSQSSVALNRVLQSDPSQIYGQINANGQVYLVNPAGVYFAPGASVNVGGIVATTHQMADADFMAGKTTFERNGATGSIVNEGRIQTALGGYIAMLAPEVRNAGVLVAQSGTVALAAGEHITLHFGADTKLNSLTVSAAQIDTLVENRQAVRAPGGLIVLSAQAASGLAASVVNSGSLEAQGVRQVGGRILLDAGLGGSVSHSGSLRVDSDSAQGGQITVTGDAIRLEAGSSIHASGATGGGTVLVGGDWQGSGTLPQATNVTLQQGASIDASATVQGDGGKVVLWSDITRAHSLTQVDGSLRAMGANGTGGLIETSGHLLGVGATASVQTGRGGLWLLDPADVTISSGAAANYTSSSGTFTPNSSANSVTINNATLATALNSGNVTVTTINNGTAGTGSGNITLSNNITWTGSGSLRLEATGNISLNASLISTGANASMLFKAQGQITTGANNLTFQTNNGSLVFWSNANSASGGGINLNSTGLTFNTANGSTNQTTGGGNLVFGGGAAMDVNGFPTGAAVSSGNAISFSAQSAGNNITRLVSGGGNITLNGTSTSTAIAFAQASVIDAGTGALRITGNSTGSGHGMEFNAFGGATNGTVVTAQGITLTGGTLATNQIGVFSANNFVNLSSTGSGNLSVTGTSNSVGGHGIDFRGTDFNLSSASGSISLTGTATSSTAISFTSPGNISSTLGGGITVNGTSTTWTGLNQAAVVNYTTSSGNISLLSSSGGSSTASMYLYGGNISTGTGNVLIQGQSSGHVGVYLTSAATNITTAGGSITVNGTSGTSYGIYSDQALSLNTSAGNGNITVNATSDTNIGLFANATLNLASAAGNINLTGTSGPGAAAGAGQGVYYRQGNVSTTTGNISLTGTSDSSYGLDFGRDTGIANVTSTSGVITLTGTTTSGTYGVNFYGTQISTSANISLLSSNQLRLDASVFSTGAGSLLLRGNSFTHMLGTAAKLGTNGSISILPTLDTAGFGATVNTNEFNINPTISNVTYVPNSLVIGNTYNTQAVNWNAVGMVAGPISVYGGTVTLSANMTSSATGDIWLQANADNSLALSLSTDGSGNIFKTGGARSNITLRSVGRVLSFYSNITSTNTGGANIVLWSDYGNTNNSGVGVGNLTSNGGHIWIGGSSTANGSLVWNGLTVGDGGSVGSGSSNGNAVDFRGSINSAGGDVLMWAGISSYSSVNSGIAAYSGSGIYAGSGHVTLIAPQIQVSVLTVNTTGTFSWAPNAASDWGATATWNGSTATGNFSTTAGTAFANLTLTNVSTLGGLTLGQYDGMAYANGTVRSVGSNSNLTMNTAMAIAGAYRLYGDNVTVNANASLSSNATAQSLLYADNGHVSLSAGFNQTNGSGSSLTLQASGNITQAAVVNITASGNSTLDVVAWANSANTTAAAQVTLGNVSTQGGSVWVGGANSSGGNGTWHGRAVGNAGVNITLAGNLSLGSGDALLWQKSGAALNTSGGNINTDSGTVVLVSDSYSGTALGLYTNGTLNFESNSGNFGAGGFVWNGSYTSANSTLVGSGTLAGVKIGRYANNLSATTGNLSSVVVGNYTGTGLNGDTVYSFASTGNVTLTADMLLPGVAQLKGANIVINGNVGAGGTNVLGLTLQASGNVTQGSNSTVHNGLSLQGGNVTLTNANNQITRLAANGVADLSITNNVVSSALDLVGISANGKVSVLNSGDILVAGDVVTTSNANSTSAPALLLAAGYNDAVGNTTHNLNINSGGSGPNGSYNLSVANGGLGLIYTGAVTSWRVPDQVGIGSGHFRYSSNMSSTGYNTTAVPLTSGLYALYREAPALTVSAASSNVTYGSTGSSALSSTAVNGDTFAQIFGAGNQPVAVIGGSVSTAGFYTVGNHSVNITGASTNLLGYATPNYVNGTMVVGKTNLTVTGTAVNNKTYDGNTAVTFGNNGTLLGVLSNGSVVDAVTLTTSGAFTNKNAGTAVAVTMADSISGADAGNYNLVQPTVSADIARRTLTLSAAQTYSASTTLTNVTLGNLVSSETLTYSAASANSSQVGSNGANFVSAITLGNQVGATATAGGLASNYQLPTTLNVSSAPVTINATPLGISANATYNGGSTFNNLVAGTNYVLTGLVGGETIASANLTVSSANVSDNTSNRITTLTVVSGNASMGNYVLGSSRNATLGANTTNVFTLAAANLTITAGSIGKTYGDDLSANLTSAAGYTPIGLLGGQTVAVDLSSTGAAPAASVAGGPYAIVPGNVTGANGFVASNYNISLVNGTLSMARAALGLEASGVYSGTTTVLPTALNVTGLKNGETLTAITALTVNDANVAATSNGTHYVSAVGATTGTANLGNYVLGNSRNATTGTNTTNVFTMTRASLMVTADNAAVFIGEALPGSYTVSYSGLVNGETAAGLIGAGKLTAGTVINAANATPAAGLYALTPSGFSAANYNVSPVNGQFTVAPADSLIVNVGSKTTTYGMVANYGTPVVRYMANGSVVVTLGMNGNQSSGSHYVFDDGAGGSVAFNLTVVGGSLSTSGNLKAGNGYQLTGTPNVTGSNLVLTNGSIFTGSLAVSPLTVSASAGNISKVYDGTTSMNGLSINLSPTALSADALTVSGAGAFSQKNVGSNLSYNVTGLALSGADASNYVLSGGTSFSGSNGTITRALLGVSANATYNGGTSFNNLVAGTHYALTGLVNGETLTTANLTVSNATVAGNSANYVTGLTVASGTADMANYQLAASRNATIGTTTNVFTVDKAALGVSANGAYSGSTQFAVNSTGAGGNLVVTGLVNNETLTAATLMLNDANVTGSNRVSSLAVSIGSADMGNYQLASAYNNASGSTSTNAFAMVRASMTVTANSSSKSYGSNVTLGTTAFTYSGAVNGETVTDVTLSSLGAVANASVAGSPYPIQVSNATASSGAFVASNYNISYVAGALTVNRANLTVTANSTSTGYGLGTTLGSSAFASNGLQNGETIGAVTLASNGSTATSHAGSYNITASGATGGTFDVNNYNVAYVNGTLTVTPANITVQVDNQSRYYGSANPATGTVTLRAGTLYNGDTLGNASLGAAAVANSSVGNYSLNASAQTLSAGQVGDYNISYTAGNLAVIPAPLTITANNASKTYGQTITFAGTEFTSTTLVNGETLGTVSLTSAGSAATAPVNGGANYSVAIGNAVGSGGFAASNYNISYVGGNLTVAAAPLGISASGVYNGTTLVSPTAFTLTGLVNGETVNSIGSVVLNNASVASANRVTAIHVANGTADMANYVLNASPNSTANTSTTNTFTLTKAALTVQADNAAMFIGDTLPGSYSVSYHGFVNGETAQTASGLNAGTVVNSASQNSGAGSYTLTPSGWSADNYNLTHANGSFTIVPANQLLIQTGALSGSYGTAAALVPVSVQYKTAPTGPVVNLTQNSSLGGNRYVYDDGLGGSVTFTLSPANAVYSGSGSLKADSYQLAGAVSNVSGGNFNGTAVYTGSLAVSPLTVSASAGNISKVYDGTTSMNGLSINLSPTALSADALTVSGAGAFSQKNVGSNLSYTVSGLVLSGTDAGNYVLSGGANTFSGSNGQIVAKLVTLTPQATSKVYDGNANASANLIQFSSQLGVAGDTVTTLTLVYDDKNVGTGKSLRASNAVISDGNGGNNYNIVYANASVGTVTRLSSVSWVGGASGNWFDPANWAGGAVPDLSNVANVLIPSGVTVSFNNNGTPPAQSGPVNIDSLGGASGNLSQSAGTLNVGTGGVTLNVLNQSGGVLTSLGPINLSGFVQSGGSTNVSNNLSTTTMDVSGGTTTVAGTTTVSGNLTVSGGNVTSQGDLIAGNLSLSNGTLTANANLRVNGTYNQISGNAGVAGNLSVDNYAQSGGLTMIAGSLAVNGGFNQSGGSTTVGANANINTTAGMQLGNLAVGGHLQVYAGNGSITQMTPSRITVSNGVDMQAPNGQIQLGQGNQFQGAQRLVDRSGDVNNTVTHHVIKVLGGTLLFAPLPQPEDAVRAVQETAELFNAPTERDKESPRAADQATPLRPPTEQWLRQGLPSIDHQTVIEDAGRLMIVPQRVKSGD